MKWEWFGNAGHYILSTHCRFHLTTLINDEFLVSTVGELAIEGDDRFQEVGMGRLYETMVFEITGRCNAPDCMCGMPVITGNEIDFMSYDDRASANAGHMEICHKWSKI